MDKLIFNPKMDNIFDFSFMDDFTTVDLAKDESGIETSELKFRDDFYCLSERKLYTAEELFKKFNIKLVDKQ